MTPDCWSTVYVAVVVSRRLSALGLKGFGATVRVGRSRVTVMLTAFDGWPRSQVTPSAVHEAAEIACTPSARTVVSIAREYGAAVTSASGVVPSA